MQLPVAGSTSAHFGNDSSSACNPFRAHFSAVILPQLGSFDPIEAVVSSSIATLRGAIDPLSVAEEIEAIESEVAVWMPNMPRA